MIIAAGTFIALAIGLAHPQPVPDDVVGPAVRGHDQRHDDHTEVEAVGLAFAARPAREARPLHVPFDNSDAFPNAVGIPWMPRPQALGLPLPLLLWGES